MAGRPRIDLDGVALNDPNNPYMTLAVFRFRTGDGLILLIPESAEVKVSWDDIECAQVDLASGSVRVRFSESFVAANNWIRGAREMTGEWLDRYKMEK